MINPLTKWKWNEVFVDGSTNVEKKQNVDIETSEILSRRAKDSELNFRVKVLLKDCHSFFPSRDRQALRDVKRAIVSINFSEVREYEIEEK
jgi:hypothetical protein